MKTLLTTLAIVALGTTQVWAQSNESLESLEPIEESTETQSKKSAQEVLNDQFQSTVVVRQAGSTTLKEYKEKGVTYKLEVDGANTPAYILSDQDGNGKIYNSSNGIENDVVVPEWTIGNW